MNQNPDFTAYALGELNEEKTKVLLDELKSQGYSEEQIAAEATQIKKAGEGLIEEYKKDASLRLPFAKREELFPKREGIPKWLKYLGYAGGTALVVVGATNLMVPNFKRYQVASPRTEEVVRQKTLTQSKPVDTRFSDSSNFSFQSVMERKVMPSVSKRKLKKARRLNYADGSAISGATSMNESIGIAPPIYPSPLPRPAEKYNREAYEKIDANTYELVSNQPLSTFSVDVDTASYANMRRFIFGGNLPPKDSIRVEELINYFSYDYGLKFDKHPVGIKVDQSISPWNKDRKLVRVALEADSPKDLTSVNKNLVFLLDVSGSMGSAKKLPLLKESMRLLTRKLKADDTIGIVVYAGASGVVLEPTKASEKLKIFNALNNLNAGGSTNGAAGIEAAYKMAKQAFVKGGVNRVILATDGDFNVGTTSQSSLIDLVEEKAKNDIFLTVIGLGMGNYQDSMLEKISNRGNGNYAYIDSLAEANKLFNVDLEKNLTTVAKDVKVQIEFNPAKVKAYRLIGYENRKLAAKDFNDDKKDAGEMGAGHTVTALYEIVPAGGKIDVPKVDDLKYAKEVKANNDSDELLTVKVRYKKPTEDKSTKFDVVLKDEKKEFKAMDDDFRFATTVASFGMKLRGDSLVDELSYRDLIKMAKASRGKDKHDFREEFIELIELSKQIDK